MSIKPPPFGKIGPPGIQEYILPIQVLYSIKYRLSMFMEDVY